MYVFFLCLVQIQIICTFFQKIRYLIIKGLAPKIPRKHFWVFGLFFGVVNLLEGLILCCWECGFGVCGWSRKMRGLDKLVVSLWFGYWFIESEVADDGYFGYFE